MLKKLKKKEINIFWKKQSSYIEWKISPKKILHFSKTLKWFHKGTLNAYSDCVLKHKNKNKKAIIYYDKHFRRYEYNYGELSKSVELFSNNIKKTINSKIKRVILYMPASIEASVCMLTMSNLGIHFSVVFEELSLKALNTRIKIFKPDFIIVKSRDKYEILLKNKSLIKVKPYLYDYIKNKKSHNKKSQIKFYESSKDFFTLFTSGTTGEPKAICHSVGNYLVIANYTCRNFFGINKNSTILTLSDAGWINGHTYSLFGILSNGATSVIFEKPIMSLNEKFLKKVLKDDKVNVLYSPVTLIRMFKVTFKKKFNSKYLKTLGSMGEPLANNVGNWYADHFNLNKKSIVNTFFQTETGGIVSAPTYKDNIKSVPHGSIGKLNKFHPLYIDKNYKPPEVKILHPWPGIFKKILNKKIFKKNYFDKNKKFRFFDTGYIKNKNIFIGGRTDDVLNVSGHRIGCAELESAILKINHIQEVSVIGVENYLSGFVIVAFVVLKNKKSYKKTTIIDLISTEIKDNFGIFAVPKKVYFVKNLPKTKSGKILRRILRDIVLKKKLVNKDVSTLNDLNIIQKIKYEISQQA